MLDMRKYGNNYKLLTVREVSLLVNKKEKTIRFWIKQGKIRALKYLGKLYIYSDSLEQFLEPVQTN